MPLDLSKIRALLARINAPVGWVYMGEEGAFPMEIRTCDGFREVVTLAADPNDTARDIADLPTALADAVAEVARLTSELAAATRPYLILDDPEGIIGCVDAASPEAAWEAFKAANPDDYDGDPEDNDVIIQHVTAELYDSVVDDLEIARSELAAAQAGPVVEWYATTVGEAARVGMFWMGIGPGGWTLRVRLPYGFGAGELIESGPETGDAGKAACIAAYRRACGLTPG